MLLVAWAQAVPSTLTHCLGTETRQWDNCWGVVPNAAGSLYYEGNWRDGKPHGTGTMYGIEGKTIAEDGVRYATMQHGAYKPTPP